jgi:hypothetical protein
VQSKKLDCFVAALLAMTRGTMRASVTFAGFGYCLRSHPRHCERSEAIHLAAEKNGLLRRYAPRNDDGGLTV